MYYSYVKIEYVATSFSPARTDLALKLLKDNISAHSQRLSVESYERYYETVLIPEVRNQYMINDGNLKDFLLSPGSR
jgi:hypothetical protein